jgi:hypothetical protein
MLTLVVTSGKSLDGRLSSLESFPVAEDGSKGIQGGISLLTKLLLLFFRPSFVKMKRVAVVAVQ